MPGRTESSCLRVSPEIPSAAAQQSTNHLQKIPSAKSRLGVEYPTASYSLIVLTGSRVYSAARPERSCSGGGSPDASRSIFSRRLCRRNSEWRSHHHWGGDLDRCVCGMGPEGPNRPSRSCPQLGRLCAGLRRSQRQQLFGVCGLAVLFERRSAGLHHQIVSTKDATAAPLPPRRR